MDNYGTDTGVLPLQMNFEGRGEVKGYSFALLRMTDKAFMYEVSSGNGKYYEVFYKRINKRFACISFPSSKSFGIWAWTFSSLKEAIKKYNELNFDY